MVPVGILTALLGFPTHAATLDLVVDGWSDYTIVVATDAIPAEQDRADQRSTLDYTLAGGYYFTRLFETAVSSMI